jgi:phosphoglycerate dehydrogenase-like enzyme
VNKLLILSAEADQYSKLIRAADLPGLEFEPARDVHPAKDLINGCNIALGDPPLLSQLLSSADRLEWVQSTWAGVEQLCRPGLRRDYILTNAKGMFGALISEYVMTYLFAFERGVFAMRSNQLKRHWKPLSYRPAKNITLGIIGLGSIGSHLAVTARHFGLRIIGLNRSGKPCEAVETVYTVDELPAFLKEPDYVVLALPDTQQTNQLINSDTLGMMKPSAVLINIGRGNSVNENDLARALDDAVIGGAVLDVFEQEPLPAESPLWKMPNVCITPHMAATSFPEHIAEVFIQNYLRYQQKKPLQHVVDFELGY